MLPPDEKGKGSSTYRFLSLSSSAALLVIISSLFLGCGIASYPYLVPADSYDLDIGGFTHKSQENPTIFLGYEIYYRIYPENLTNEDSDIDTIKQDLKQHFNNIDDFNEVSNDRGNVSGDPGVDSSQPYFLAVASYTEDTPASDSLGNQEPGPPLLPIIDDFKQISFDVELSQISNLNTYGLTIVDDAYPDDNSDYPRSVNVFRRVVDEDTSRMEPFTDAISDYSDSQIDIPESSDRYSIAFFAVPYGEDDFERIYANNRGDNITFIGAIPID